MSKSKYTKDGMIQLLKDLSSAMKSEIPHFSGLAPVVLAMTEAAKDPCKTHESNKVAAATGATAASKPVKPVSISYTSKDIHIKTPWDQAGKALGDALKAIVGNTTKSINPETGKPWFKSIFNKKVKAHVVSRDKEAEVLAAIEASGLPVVKA